jgi:hypothetical protein
MRSVPLLLTLLLFAVAAAASEIREFDVKTLERLGNELTRVSRQPDRGAADAVRKRAQQTAIDALKGRLFKIHYDYVVLGDPDGNGYLVYALAVPNRPDEVVLAGHFRVTVSSDGAKAERVDALSKTLAITNRKGGGAPGTDTAALWMIQLVSSRPVETLIYTSNLVRLPIVVATTPGGRVWEIENGRIKDTGKSVGKKQ